MFLLYDMEKIKYIRKEKKRNKKDKPSSFPPCKDRQTHCK